MLDHTVVVWCREGVEGFGVSPCHTRHDYHPCARQDQNFSEHKFGIFGFRSPKIPNFTLIRVRVFPTSRDGNGRMKGGIFYHFSH